MTIQKIHDGYGNTSPTETWYIATQSEATGYGTTHYNALIACLRDITRINALQ
jgi:hypothetical protein